MQNQISIKESVRVDGINVYNGNRNFVVFYPAREDSGLIFRFKNKNIIPSLNNAHYLRKAIGIDDGVIKIHLVEHVLSAIYALGIDNLLIELSDNVCPTTDNCAKEYFSALEEIRTIQSNKKRFWAYKKDLETIVRSNEKRGPDYIKIKPSKELIINYLAYYPHKAVGEQRYTFKVNEESYKENIMEARSPTFILNGAFKRLFLLLGGFGLHGINEKNSLLITSKNVEEYANSKPFGAKYERQEFVRHKILDVLGTLALTGKQFKKTEFEFNMTGHKFDLYALKILFDMNCFTEST